MATTYGGGNNTEDTMSAGKTEVVGQTITDFSAEASKEHKEYTEEAKEAENEGKEVQQGNDGETYIIEEPATEEEKEESSNTEGSVLDDDKLSQMLPEKIEDNKENTTETEDIKENATETEDIKENATETEDIKEDTTETEDIKEDATETEDIKEDATETEDIKEDATETEDIKEDTTEEKEQPVKVTALDGYTTVVDSQIQFRVDGDNVQVEGLEGFDYTLNNGVLTINVGSEATVLTVNVFNSTSNQMFDITVNGIIG